MELGTVIRYKFLILQGGEEMLKLYSFREERKENEYKTLNFYYGLIMWR